MSDIFLNYVLDNLDKAEKLCDAFRQEGWTVWRHNQFALLIGMVTGTAAKELKGAKVMVTLWSWHAARRFSTARRTLERLALSVFVLIDEYGAPLPEYVRVPPFDLSDWDGEESHPELQNLLRHLRQLIASSSPMPKPPASLEELSPSEIQENAGRGIQESAARAKDGAQFRGVFISYRRNEAAAYAGRLYDRLAARFGRGRVFIDTENIGWGEDFVEAITAAAEGCAVMIALVSPRWSRGAGGREGVDDYVRLEVATALGRKIRVIPILIQGASMPAPKDLPEDLSPLVRRNALALSDNRWERDVEDLIKTLEKLLNV